MTRPVVLVVNAGSTSLKLLSVAADESVTSLHSLEEVDPAAIDAVAHRIVHGGTRFLEPLVINSEVEAEIASLAELAPLHNAPAVAAVGEARQLLSRVPHIAVFDTAFHASLPDEARTYALPRRFREEFGIRRYGFHGLSVQWASEQVRVRRLVVCHLGGGCSVTAVLNGRSVDTTMGFTPLEGVPMATRAGSVDPGALLHLLRKGLATPDMLDTALEHESGLLGLSEISASVEELERSPAPGARRALAVFSYRVAQAVAALAVPLRGLDAVTFTAGIGENSAPVRERVCAHLAWLGVELDPGLNRLAQPDVDVSAAGSPVRVFVLRAREELIAARAARELLEAGV